MISNFSKIYRRFIVNEIHVDSDDVVGLVEKIDIKGIGEVDAKIDSGNGAYNVIDGEVISKRGDNIIIKTIGGKKLKKKVISLKFRLEIILIQFMNISPCGIKGKNQNQLLS